MGDNEAISLNADCDIYTAGGAAATMIPINCLKLPVKFAKLKTRLSTEYAGIPNTESQIGARPPSQVPDAESLV